MRILLALGMCIITGGASILFEEKVNTVEMMTLLLVCYFYVVAVFRDSYSYDRKTKQRKKMSDEIKFKECPFCGGVAKLRDMGSKRYHISCQSCRAQIGDTWGDSESIDNLINAWNKRV